MLAHVYHIKASDGQENTTGLLLTSCCCSLSCFSNLSTCKTKIIKVENTIILQIGYETRTYILHLLVSYLSLSLAHVLCL